MSLLFSDFYFVQSFVLFEIKLEKLSRKFAEVLLEELLLTVE